MIKIQDSDMLNDTVTYEIDKQTNSATVFRSYALARHDLHTFIKGIGIVIFRQVTISSKSNR